MKLRSHSSYNDLAEKMFTTPNKNKKLTQKIKKKWLQINFNNISLL